MYTYRIIGAEAGTLQETIQREAQDGWELVQVAPESGIQYVDRDGEQRFEVRYWYAVLRLYKAPFPVKPVLVAGSLDVTTSADTDTCPWYWRWWPGRRWWLRRNRDATT